jgi:hypothetical protein
MAKAKVKAKPTDRSTRSTSAVNREGTSPPPTRPAPKALKRKAPTEDDDALEPSAPSSRRKTKGSHEDEVRALKAQLANLQSKMVTKEKMSGAREKEKQGTTALWIYPKLTCS